MSLHARFFQQPQPFARLALLRASLGAVCALLVGLGPYGAFYVESAPFLYPADAWLPALGPESFAALKLLVLGSGVATALGLLPRLATLCLALSFGWLNFYISRFGGLVWSYNTHLVCFLGALVWVDTSQGFALWVWRRAPPPPAGEEWASFVLACLQLYIAVMYFQTGLAKLLQGGAAWFLGGQTIYVNALVLGLARGRWAAQTFPWMFPLLGLGTAVLEFGFLPVWCGGRGLRGAVGVAILFHCGTFALLGISFWHLWTLYPALFFYRAGPLTRPPRPGPGLASGAP